MRIILDIETNGLLPGVSKVHCIGIRDIDSDFNKLYVVKNNEIPLSLLILMEDVTDIIMHNGIGFDLPVLAKLCNWIPSKENNNSEFLNCTIHDTYITSQLLFPDIVKDGAGHGGGGHSLKSWGERLDCKKGEYVGGWELYNEDMGIYCLQDTEVTKKLFLHFLTLIKDTDKSYQLEHDIAPILIRQWLYGIEFDVNKAITLCQTFEEEHYTIRNKLLTSFPAIYINKGEIVPKVNNKAKGITAGVAYSKIELQEFNPASRLQIINRLKTQYNWVPVEFTDKKTPILDEETLKHLKYPEIELLRTYFMLNKRLGQVKDGKQAWLSLVNDNDELHGEIRQNGAITGRMAHYRPNLAQVPAVYSLYGKECRELFKARHDKVLVGCDADALEMRCLGGYLSSYDDGQFIKIILEGKKEEGTDAHSVNARALGCHRDIAKTWFYGMLYGAGSPKLGRILEAGGVKPELYVPDFDKKLSRVTQWAREKDISHGALKLLVLGAESRERYGKKLPHLNLLIKDLVNEYKEKKYITAIDGRRLTVRSEHAILNMLLQSAGAIFMKKALSICDIDLQKSGLVAGQNYEFVLNVHDEWQIEVDNNPEFIARTQRIAEESIKKAGEFFNFTCPLSGSSKVGANWAETH